jgi:hypothetical protein
MKGQGYKMRTYIDYINKKTKFGFIGMNKDASVAHHIAWKHKKHPEETIEIYKHMPKDVRTTTEHHEQIERYLMRIKHMPYHQAHYNALRFEKYNKPLPKSRIKENLKKMGFRIKWH